MIVVSVMHWVRPETVDPVAEEVSHHEVAGPAQAGKLVAQILSEGLDSTCWIEVGEKTS